MNNKYRRFAPIALYLSGLALIVSAGLFIVMREWSIYTQISVAVILLGLALYVLMAPDNVRRFLTGRQVRYGSNALIMGLAFLGIVVVVNYVAYKNPQRWDLTEEKSRTLAQETLDTLEALPQPVKAVAFYPPNVPIETVQNILEDYKYYGKGKFDYEFVDPYSDPVAAREANVSLQASGTIVLYAGERQEKAAYASEQEITGAMVRLMSEKQSVYFLTGHGEYSADKAGEESYSEAKRVLESKNYSVGTLNLLAEKEIPEDARAIIISGPTTPIPAEEIELLSEFQKNGGALVVLLEPTIMTGFGDQADPLVEYLAQTWDIRVGNDMILDGFSQNAFQVVAYEYASHAVTAKIAQQNLNLVFPFARSVRMGEGIEGVTNTEILRTHQNSWAETDLAGLADAMQGNAAPEFDGQADLPGPVPIAVAGENASSGARVLVIGDSHFAIDANFGYLGNGDLFINAVDWATEQESLINLTPRQQVQRLMVTPSAYTMGAIFLVTVVIVPGLVVVGGIVNFVMRRKRG